MNLLGCYPSNRETASGFSSFVSSGVMQPSTAREMQRGAVMKSHSCNRGGKKLAEVSMAGCAKTRGGQGEEQGKE